MSVQLVLRGSLGSHLFQYAVARILAANAGLALACRQERPADRSSGDGPPLTLEEAAALFFDVPLILDGTWATGPMEAYEVGGEGMWDGQTLPFGDMLANRRPRHIRLNGFFQRAEYILTREALVREWYELAEAGSATGTPPRDVLLHVYRPDTADAWLWCLPLSYYDEALASLADVGTVTLCGTGISADVVEHFSNYEPRVLPCSGTDVIRVMRSYRRIVLANTPLSWWSGWLSDAREIVGPAVVKNLGYAFSGFGNIDLHMRHRRYREVRVSAFAHQELKILSNITGAQVLRAGEDLWISTGDRRVLKCPRGSEPGMLHRLTQHDELPMAPDNERWTHGAATTLRSFLLARRLAVEVVQWREP
jgi:hypothetical protein